MVLLGSRDSKPGKNVNTSTPPQAQGTVSTPLHTSPDHPVQAAPRPTHLLRRTSASCASGQWLGLTIGVLLLFAVTGIGLALIATHRLNVQRDIVLNQVEPALHDALDLEAALINEETGVRGYVITAKPEFLQPYYTGRPPRPALMASSASRAGSPG